MELVFCDNCGDDLSEFHLHNEREERHPCPNCGSLNRTFNQAIKVQATAEIHLGGKHTSGKKIKSGKRKRPSKETWFGASKTLTDNTWKKLLRIIDREKGRYYEKVEDPIEGKVIHEIDEPLKKHLNHGSAKSKKT